MYQIFLSHRAENDLKKIPQDTRIRIELALERFATNPDLRHDVVKVKESLKKTPRYRLRIGEYQATFFIHRDILIIEIITV